MYSVNSPRSSIRRHVVHHRARLVIVKALRCAPTPQCGAYGLDDASGERRDGNDVTTPDITAHTPSASTEVPR